MILYTSTQIKCDSYNNKVRRLQYWNKIVLILRNIILYTAKWDYFILSYCDKYWYIVLVFQIVCDTDMMIRDLECRWPGATHDAYMLSMSSINTQFENRQYGDYMLLGDSGYPLKPWLITPLNNPNTEGERRFNTAHKAARCVVERCIGLLKSRFR